MNKTIIYRRPEITILGTVMEEVRGTLTKGHKGVIEGIQWHILPAYDLGE